MSVRHCWSERETGRETRSILVITKKQVETRSIPGIANKHRDKKHVGTKTEADYDELDKDRDQIKTDKTRAG